MRHSVQNLLSCYKYPEFIWYPALSSSAGFYKLLSITSPSLADSWASEL